MLDLKLNSISLREQIQLFSLENFLADFSHLI